MRVSGLHPVSKVFAEDLRRVWAECFRVHRPSGVLLAGLMNPLYFLFDHEAARASLVIKYPLLLRSRYPDPAESGSPSATRGSRFFRRIASTIFCSMEISAPTAARTERKCGRLSETEAIHDPATYDSLTAASVDHYGENAADETYFPIYRAVPPLNDFATTGEVDR